MNLLCHGSGGPIDTGTVDCGLSGPQRKGAHSAAMGQVEIRGTEHGVGLVLSIPTIVL